MASYGNIHYVVSYADAPKTAEYIIRRLYDGRALLERYSLKRAVCCPLRVFSETAYTDEDDFIAMLTVSRELINSSKTIWVESPPWR